MVTYRTDINNNPYLFFWGSLTVSTPGFFFASPHANDLLEQVPSEWEEDQNENRFVKGCLCKTVRRLNSFHLVLFRWLLKCFHPTLTLLSELLFKLPFQPLLVFAFDFYLVVVMAKYKRACLGSLYSLNPALKQRYLMTWGWHLPTIFLPNRLPYFEVTPRSRLRTIQLSEKLLLSLNTSKCSNQGVSSPSRTRRVFGHLLTLKWNSNKGQFQPNLWSAKDVLQQRSGCQCLLKSRQPIS